MPCPPFPDPPEAIAATWESGTTLIEVTFSQPLVEGALDTANWSYLPPSPAVITAAQAVGSTVQLTLSTPPPSVTAVSYAPPPFDVVGLVSGEPAEAFAGLPVS